MALDQARHRASGDRQRLGLHRLVFRRDMAVPDDIGAAHGIDAHPAHRLLRHELRRHQEDFPGRASVHVHFLINGATCGDLHEARREHGRDRRRGEQHLAEQIERLRPARDRDRPHVPDHRTLGVEIGGADQQPAAFAVLRGHLSQEGIVHIKGDDPGKRRVARERVAAEQPPDRLHDGDVLGIGLGKDLLQGLIVFRSEKGKGRGERAGRHSRDEIELRPLAGSGPTGKDPCPERAVRPAARQREEIDHRSATARQQLGPVGTDLRPFLANHGIRIGWKLVAPIADLRRAHADHLDMTFERRRHWIAGDGRGAADQRQGQQQSPDDPSQRIPPFDAELPEAWCLVGISLSRAGD